MILENIIKVQGMTNQLNRIVTNFLDIDSTATTLLQPALIKLIEMDFLETADFPTNFQLIKTIASASIIVGRQENNTKCSQTNLQSIASLPIPCTEPDIYIKEYNGMIVLLRAVEDTQYCSIVSNSSLFRYPTKKVQAIGRFFDVSCDRDVDEFTLIDLEHGTLTELLGTVHILCNSF